MLMAATPQANGMAWLPRRSAPAWRGTQAAHTELQPPEQTVYIMADSAGKSARAGDKTMRAGACWFWTPGMKSSVPYVQEIWHADVLSLAHSTQLEAANANKCLACAMAHFPDAKVFIEVLDSSPAVDVFRTMSASATVMAPIIHERWSILDAFRKRMPDGRVLSCWDERAHGTIPDNISKNHLAAANAALTQRIGLCLASAPLDFPPNLLNADHTLVVAQLEGGKRSAQDKHPNCERGKRTKRSTPDANDHGNGA
jgi:hypothetical protein